MPVNAGQANWPGRGSRNCDLAEDLVKPAQPVASWQYSRVPEIPTQRAERELRAIVAAAETDTWLPSLTELSQRLGLSRTVLARAMQKWPSPTRRYRPRTTSRR